MCQNTNDYSLLTANTGMTTVKTANNSLDGQGALQTVLTAGDLGTIIKSVTIKAIQPTSTGMIRLYILTAGASNLYKEVPVPINPMLQNVPMPAPVLPMFEICLKGDLKLQAGARLQASTQNGESFNVIAEGLDWKYPATLPYSCCNYIQEVGNTGVNRVGKSNTKLDGSGIIQDIFTAGTTGNGATIKAITIKALQSTGINGMIRIFLKTDVVGADYILMKEVPVPQTTQSAFEPSFKCVLSEGYNLQAGYTIAASTQNDEPFSIIVEATDWSYPIS